MRILFCALLLCLCCWIPGGAQVPTLKADVTVGVFTLTNDRGQIRDNVGLLLGGGVRIGEQWYAGAEVTGDHDDANGGRARTHTRFFATYNLIYYRGVGIEIGAGGGKIGNEALGFGQVGLHLGRLTLAGRYGNQDFAEAEGSFELAKGERWAFRPFYRLSRVRFPNSSAEDERHAAGVRFTVQ